MQRISIIGCAKAGKPTFTKELAKILGLPLIHLDKHYWTPNWVSLEKDEWETKHEELINQEAWIMDGNYNSTLKQRLSRSTSAIFLDYRISLCLRCVKKRIKMYEIGSRPDLAEGCHEKHDQDFLKWFKRKVRPKIIKNIQENDNLDVIVFKKPKDSSVYLKKLNNFQS